MLKHMRKTDSLPCHEKCSLLYGMATRRGNMAEKNIEKMKKIWALVTPDDIRASMVWKL